ncbi:MAG: WbqC family protein [Pseudomonadota bacterium]|nr:WbqC family protein [Pseudomonadota bacterium]
MIVSVHQPQYLPWLGYFDKIDRADVFVLLDNVQFKKNEWQNRNRIKTPRGPQWLTVPVLYKFPQLISEVGINDRERWQHKQRQAILSNYRKAPHWTLLESFFSEIFSRTWATIAELNIHVVRELATIMGITTPLQVASELPPLPDDPDERLIAITHHYGGDVYLAGSGGHDYMDLAKYERAGVEVVFQDYRHPSYPQLWGDFEPFMSVVDLIYNQGREALEIIRRGR